MQVGNEVGYRSRITLVELVWFTLFMLIVAAHTLAACAGESDQAVVTVYAASSLTDIMAQVETDFEQANPDIDIRVNLAGSNTLVRQLNNGAPADLFLAADVSVLDNLTEPPLAEPTLLAVNSLTLVVPAVNTAGVAGPADLAKADVLTARCATGVPCGNATDEFLSQSGVELARSTDEPNVRSVLAKVSADEVDAGFVYRSDLTAAVDVAEIPLSDPPRVTVAVAQLRAGAEVDAVLAMITSEPIADLFDQLRFERPDR